MSEREAQLCVLEVGGEHYVVDLKRVEEILPVQPLTPVPKAPAFLEGVVKLRGEVVPVVDVRRRLGVQPAAVATPGPRVRRRERMVVCRLGRRRVGFLVDAVTKVLRVDRAALQPAPLSVRPGHRPHVLGVVGEPGALKLMLDLLSLVTEDA
ncbi:MAG: chemotaxis protein CheW [Myxococcaceae bacterium]|jgi:purine-binding chemotaxis protein CheW|nr:chemotaxis protein CheW [Myxococcaceae bacterium]MCA3012411.1 chemotaxis protein CheW [Myxococcaceae bacterium]